MGRVIYIEGNINPTIAGLHITGGEAKDLGSPIGIDAGGGVLVISATATLKDNYIYKNSADSTHNGDGGGVFLLDSDATLESNTVFSNTAEREGGGINLANSPATLTGNTISQNNSDRGQGAGLVLGFSPATVDGNTISENYGVGLWVDQTAANITNNTIISNTSGGIFLWQCNNARVIANNISYNSGGGGVQSWGDNILISGNTISHNTAEWGGGISPVGNDVLIRGNTIDSNNAVYEGGGVWYGDGEINLFRNTIISNTAASGAGLGCSLACTGMVAGNYFSGNHATADGGGILIGGNPVLKNNIIVDNRADSRGSGIMIAAGSLSSFLHNTVARNEGSSGIFIPKGTVALTNNIIVSHTLGLEVDSGAIASLEATMWGTATWANTADWAGDGTIITGTTNIWGDPDFVNYLAGDYHIGENSDAIDAGIEAGVTTDIDFHPRPYQLPDIGADEYWPPGTLKIVNLPLVIK
jgi:parallel beta-helix repeat protein